MKRLNKKQIKILDHIYEKTGTIFFDALAVDTVKTLEDINNYETMWMDVTRYLHDRNVSKKYNKQGDI